MKFIKKRVVFFSLVILICFLISNILPIESLPDFLKNLIWDQEKVAPILNILFTKYFWPFIGEIVLIAFFLIAAGFLYLYVFLKTVNSKLIVYINMFILFISSVPSFLLSLFVVRYNLIKSDIFAVIAISILGNLVLYFFLRKQRWYLAEEIKKDYVKASIIRGDKLLFLIIKQYMYHMLNSIEELFSYIIMSLIISEITLNHNLGLTNLVYNKFLRYQSDSEQYPYGISYLIWMLIFAYIILLLLQTLNESLDVFNKRQNANSITNIDILKNKYKTSRGSIFNSFFSFIHNKRLITQDENNSFFYQYLRHLIRWFRSLSNSISNNKEYSFVIFISLSILLFFSFLGNSVIINDSYINRVNELENKITYIQNLDNHGDSYYFIDYNNKQIVPLIYKSEYDDKILNQSSENIETISKTENDFFNFEVAEDNNLSEQEEKIEDNFFNMEFSNDTEDSSQVEKLYEIDTFGYSSWTRSDFKKYFYRSDELSKYFPFGTNSIGESIIRKISIILINYLKPTLAMIVITVLGGILFSYLNILLYKKQFYIISTAIHTFFVALDSIPKFILILLFLPFLNSNFYQQDFMHYEFVFMGFIFIPVMYKQIYNKVMYYIHMEFIQAQEFIGASFNKIFFYHILLKNSIKQFISNICEIISVSILIESSLGFLGLVVGKYDSIGSLLTTNLFDLKNIMEVFIPILIICLIIILSNLLIEIFQDEQ